MVSAVGAARGDKTTVTRQQQVVNPSGVTFQTVQQHAPLNVPHFHRMVTPADDVAIDMDMNDTPDMSVDSDDARATFDDLAKAYQAAKGLGDEKLIQQLANTITYFNKNIILK